jgi:hypothetical protein
VELLKAVGHSDLRGCFECCSARMEQFVASVVSYFEGNSVQIKQFY